MRVVGLRSPVILRTSNSAGSHERYRLIGPCNVPSPDDNDFGWRTISDWRDLRLSEGKATNDQVGMAF